MYYKITTVNGIEAKHKKDPEESCKGLFEDWLSTNNGAGAGPKTWVTLLKAIGKVKKLSKAREEILKELTQFSSGTSGLLNIPYMIKHNINVKGAAF